MLAHFRVQKVVQQTVGDKTDEMTAAGATIKTDVTILGATLIIDARIVEAGVMDILIVGGEKVKGKETRITTITTIVQVMAEVMDDMEAPKRKAEVEMMVVVTDEIKANF